MTNQAIYILGREKGKTIEIITTTYSLRDGHSITTKFLWGGREEGVRAEI